jgi:hypothetical protein
MVLFAGSHTAQTIQKDGWLIANIIHDPVLYVKTAFEDLPNDMFVEETVSGITMQRLDGAEAWAAFTAEVEKSTSEAVVVSLTLKKEIMEDAIIHPVNRGFNSILDATVHATRYVMNHDPKLGELIEYHAGIVRKCGGKQELAALDLLIGYIGKKEK